MRFRPLSVTAIVAALGIGMLLSPTDAIADADEETVPLSVAYGWYYSGRWPDKLRMHLSEKRIYEEWDSDPAIGEKSGWIQFAGRFKPLSQTNRYVLTIDRISTSPGAEGVPADCPFAELHLVPSVHHAPPLAVNAHVIFYFHFDEKTGAFSDECSRLTWYSYDMDRNGPAKKPE